LNVRSLSSSTSGNPPRAAGNPSHGRGRAAQRGSAAVPLARPRPGRVLVFGKGRDWHWLPLDPDVLAELRRCFREIGPELDDHVFTVELEQWASNEHRVRRRKDPKQPASSQALWRMVRRVCERAGVRAFSPHPLRHGFANRFLRESGRDVVALQALMRHSGPDTTQGYTDEVELEEHAEALGRAARGRRSQASPDEATADDEPSRALESQEWRRRESNPRPQPRDV
jgi:integrase